MMKILNDLISALDLEASVRDVRQGVFHTGVVTRNCGLASTLPRDALRQERPLIKSIPYRSVAIGDSYCSHCLRYPARSSDLFAERKSDHKNGTLPHLTIHRNRSLMPVNDAVYR